MTPSPKMYSEYTVPISTDPSVWDRIFKNCLSLKNQYFPGNSFEARRLADEIGKLIESEFPGINVVMTVKDGTEGDGGLKITGPDKKIRVEISDWIAANWIVVL